MDLMLFEKNNLKITPIVMGEEIFFLPSQIGAILDYADLADSIRKSKGYIEGKDFVVVDGEKLAAIKSLQHSRSITPGVQENAPSLILLTESGFYGVCFRSNKPEAVEFRLWVTSEVLPELRKKGGYIAEKKEETNEELMARAALVAMATLERIDAKRKLAETERDDAIRTKAEIGTRREATSMATASIAVREKEKLEMELGKHRKMAAVITVETALGRKFAWHPLKKYCVDHELDMTYVKGHPTIDLVLAYPAEAWWAVYEISLEELFGRKR